MEIEPNLNDISRTAAALEAYDAFNETFDAVEGLSQKEVLAWFDKLDALDKAVGIAFCTDTADRNSMSNAGSVHAGRKVPNPGEELAFVRRCVKQWKERTADKV